MDGEALIIHYSNLMNGFLIFFIVYFLTHFLRQLVAMLLIFLSVIINEKMGTIIPDSYDCFFWHCVKPRDLWEICNYKVCIPVKLVFLLLNMERVFELYKKKTNPKTNPTNSTTINKSQVTMSSSALIFGCFEPLSLFLFVCFLGSATLLLSEKSHLHLDAPNWELPVT